MPVTPENILTLSDASLLDSMEGPYLLEVFRCLEAEMGERFGQFKFVVYSLPTNEKPDLDGYAGPDVVLLVRGDNTGAHYLEELSGFRSVFKVHLVASHGHVHPMPLGYTKAHLYGCETPVRDRAVNVFYSGNINANRVDLWRSLQFERPWPAGNIRSRFVRRGIVYGIRKLRPRSVFDNVFPDSVIRFTDGFGKGMGPEEYSAALAGAKISISPFGYCRAECFRHFESMRAGCVSITDRLPPTWYFKGSPILQIERWSDLRKMVDGLLADMDRLTELQSATIRWYNEKCSPVAVARYMAGIILRGGQSDLLTNVCPPKHQRYR